MRGRRKSLADILRISSPPASPKAGGEAADGFAQWTGNQRATRLSVVVNSVASSGEDIAKPMRVGLAEWLAAEADAMRAELKSDPPKPVKSRRFSMAVRNLMRASATAKKRSDRGRKGSAAEDSSGGRKRTDTLTGLTLGMELGLVLGGDENEWDLGLLSSDDELDARPPAPPNHAPPNQRPPRPRSVGATQLGGDAAAAATKPQRPRPLSVGREARKVKRLSSAKHDAEARTSFSASADVASPAEAAAQDAAAESAAPNAVVADAAAAEAERRRSTTSARRARRRSARWVATHDERNGEHWFDLVSMTTVWTMPAGFDESSAAHWVAKLDPGGSGHFYYENTRTGESTWDAPHDLTVEIVHDTHWVLHYDPSTEREYYFDVASGASAWLPPEDGFDPASALAQWVGHPDPTHPGYYVYKHCTSGEVSHEPPPTA